MTAEFDCSLQAKRRSAPWLLGEHSRANSLAGLHRTKTKVIPPRCIEQASKGTLQRSRGLSFSRLPVAKQEQVINSVFTGLQQIVKALNLPATVKKKNGCLELEVADLPKCLDARIAIVSELEKMAFKKPACRGLKIKLTGSNIPPLLHREMSINDFILRRGFLTILFELELPTLDRWSQRNSLDLPDLGLTEDDLILGTLDMREPMRSYLHMRDEHSKSVAAELTLQLMATKIGTAESDVAHREQAHRIQNLLMQETLRIKARRAREKDGTFQKITAKLAEFHDERDKGTLQTQLKKIKELMFLCHQWELSAHAQHSPFREQVKQLHGQCQLKRKYLTDLLDAYESDRKSGPPSPERVRVKATARLEKLDPLNRAWGVKDTAWSNFYLDAGKGHERPLQFFSRVEQADWSARLDPHSLIRMSVSYVRYLSASERAQYLLTPSLLGSGEKGFMQEAKPFSTTEAWTATSGSGKAIFAYLGGELYAAPHELATFHHSSFFGGRDVECAGEIEVKNGVLVGLTLKSGHYKPRRRAAKALLNYLHAAGISLVGVPIQTVEKIPFPVHFPGRVCSLNIRREVNYDADELRREFRSENGYLAPRRAKRGSQATILAELKRYFGRKPALHAMATVAVPYELQFDVDAGEWVGTDPRYIYSVKDILSKAPADVRPIGSESYKDDDSGTDYDDDGVDGYIAEVSDSE